MAQIRVSDRTYAEIVRVKARLEEMTGRHLTFCDTLRFLCDLFNNNYQEWNALKATRTIDLLR
ncbi:MAG: hypothetical protein NZ920_05150 [Aigarchaeota archaeon]|nr:hypothetical protein [Aigarchaeota archaeon]MDW8093321.1 hypothetical protein [Nitrososphaerota archaeon]